VTPERAPSWAGAASPMARRPSAGYVGRMKISEVMTPFAKCIGPESTLVEAARQMRELDIGALPICENDRLAGMVTDRDLALRGIGEGLDPTLTPVRTVMSAGIVYVFEDQDVGEAARLMEVKQIRRLAVLNRDKRLVGIVSLGDLAVDASPALSGEALREISQPVHHAGR
jgi:CBS domain-containing protein